jgi:hypothetical protein
MLIVSQAVTIPETIVYHSALSSVNTITRHKLSMLNYECSNCQAVHFLEEKNSHSRVGALSFSKCCSNGKVVLPNIHQPTPQIMELFTYHTASKSICNNPFWF